MGLRVNWGHASARQLKGVLTEPNEENMHLVNYVHEVLEQCEICRASGKAPHVPIAGATTFQTFNG